MSELRFKDITNSLTDGFDPVLREELFSKLESLKTEDEALKGVQLFLQRHGRDYELMRNTFKSFNELLDSKEKQAKKINLSWVKYAAVLVVMAGIGYYYFKNKTLDLTAYEYHNAGLPVLMGSDDNKDFNNGMSSYKLQKYQQALVEFSKCDKSDTVIYYTGECFYHLNQYQNAITEFEKISYPSIYNEEAHYLKSLAYINLGESDKALGILVGLASSSNQFRQRANNLYESLTKHSLPKEYKQAQ